jgi:hypothetical protein
MDKEELEKIIEKCQSLSSKYYQRNNEEKASLYERIAWQLEDDIDSYVDNESFVSEQEVIEDIKNLIDEVDNFYDDEDYENMDMLD